MDLETTRFGTVTVDESAIITFTHPIIGFQNFRRFVLMPGPQGSRVNWLQSTESGELAFILMNPEEVVPGYEVDIGPHELAELAVESVDELDVFTLVVVPSDPKQTRTNLKAPILINAAKGLGKQTILEKSSYPIQFILAQAQNEAAKQQEA